jgi:predicted AAA+ superfamily ATPase
MFIRLLDLTPQIRERSIFLFGPRQTGKTTLLRTLFPEAVTYNLLEADTFRDLAARPELIRERLTGRETLVVIDEIQRLPSLLNEVQVIIDRDPRMRFVLTGSSARTLRRGGTNLLGGRARVAHLFPLVWPEAGLASLAQRLSVGSLPAVVNASSPWEDLRTYVGTYLQEEIRAEGLVRSIETFSRFLDVAATANGQLVNFTAIGSDAGVPPRTVREHFQLLEDTLIGNLLPPYQRTTKRKPVATAKFFLFDVGVANYLLRRRFIEPGSPEYGATLEHLIYLELRAGLSYGRREEELTFWRSQSKLEVDFVVGDSLGIEVKAATRVADRALTGLRALAEDAPQLRKVVVCQEPAWRRTADGIEIWPLAQFLDAWWRGELLP